jgi:hypothetical protein
VPEMHSANIRCPDIHGHYDFNRLSYRVWCDRVMDDVNNANSSRRTKLSRQKLNLDVHRPEGAGATSHRPSVAYIITS